MRGFSACFLGMLAVVGGVTASWAAHADDVAPTKPADGPAVTSAVNDEPVIDRANLPVPRYPQLANQILTADGTEALAVSNAFVKSMFYDRDVDNLIKLTRLPLHINGKEIKDVAGLKAFFEAYFLSMPLKWQVLRAAVFSKQDLANDAKLKSLSDSINKYGLADSAYAVNLSIQSVYDNVSQLDWKLISVFTTVVDGKTRVSAVEGG